MKKVSIIIPCFNHAEFLAETLNSVLSQTYKNWECIVVNDGSTDNTEEIVSNYCRKDERIKYVSQRNMGVSAARNRGIQESDGYFILPLDGDDIIDSTYIEKAACYFEENPQTTLVYCKADFFGAENGPWNLPEYDYESFIWSNCIFSSAIYKRTDYNSTHGYNTNMVKGLEDWDFLLSLLNKNSLVYRIDEILFHYRIKTQSRTINANKNFDFLLRQIVLNHQDIYSPYTCDIIQMHNEMEQAKETIKRLENSHAYRFGCFFLKPKYWWKNMFRKK